MRFNGDRPWALVAALLAALCFMVSRFALRGKPVLVSPESRITPFTLRLEITSFAHDPRGEPHRRQTIGVRSDGSRSTTSTILGRIGLEAGETARTIQFSDGRKFTFFPSIRAKNTWPPLSQAAVDEVKARLVNPPENCLSSDFTLVGFDTLVGQGVATVTHISELLGWKVTDWRAPKLSCQSLRYLSYDKQPDGTFKLQVESKVVKLELGEPDLALFEQSPDYEEMKPSEVDRAFAAKYHISMTKELLEHDRVQDQAYFGTLRSGSPTPRPAPRGR